jgi:hypothetical protein
MVVNIDLFIGLYAYLQEFTMLMFNGKSETTIARIGTAAVLRILMRYELVNELTGRYVQCKNTQQCDSQYFM